MNYDIDWLIEESANNRRIKFLFFWGHRPAPDGSITSSCLSQWWKGHPFTVNKITYPTAEHWMMASKARLFEDEECLKKILESTSPGKAKKLGREVKGFNQRLWNQKRSEIVVTGNYHKFSQHEDLKDFLQGSKLRVIAEASPRDQIWGIGLPKSHPDAQWPAKWKGLNLLGFALMEVRDMLSENE